MQADFAYSQDRITSKVSIKLSTEATSYNQDFAVETPTDAVTPEELASQLQPKIDPSSGFQDSQDARVLSSASQLCTSLELYYIEYGVYPQRLAELNNYSSRALLKDVQDSELINYRQTENGKNYQMCITLEVLSMGFEPLVLGNTKGFLNHTPTKDEMKYWANRQGISLDQVTSFTDGTKIQIEQTLVANGLRASIAQQGMIGTECVDYQDRAKRLAERADSLGVKISDYVLSPKSPAGVFIAAKHEAEQAPYLRYYKLGEVPYYVLTRPFHLCHLEISKTIRQVLRGEGVLLNNGENPQISVATIAKRRLIPGEIVKRGIGSFAVRGEAVKIAENPQHVPIGLVFDVVLKRYVEPEQIITFDDIEIPESQALVAWGETIKQK